LSQGEYSEYGISSASDMNKLRWDCNLEAIAARLVQNCPEDVPLSSVEHAMNFNYYGPYTAEEVLRSPITASMWKWTEIANAGWPADNVFNGNEVLRSFANMVSANATAAGCYSSTCVERASSACVFSQCAITNGVLVYTSGTPCENGGQCVSPKTGVCEYGICVLAR
uniref:SCP domain-containing protein n=1 Tax=Angiostrongylus cantonensis TaxID=6313 RepID=A0A0K0DRC1_ANGCA